MKRAGNLINSIVEPDNLRFAFWKAQKGKSGNQEVIAFAKNLDKNLVLLREGIINNTVEIGNYHYFKIYDPKERLICAASFPERVLHHAMMNICHNAFESYQISDSYACRLNKGTFAALDKAKHFQKHFKWFLKLDIRKYFDSINHQVLISLLKKRFKDKEVIHLLERIIVSYQSKAGCGVPIGNLTSQYFANHYLGLADHFAKENLQLPAYVRYMDDMVLWGNSQKQLIEAGRQFVRFINDILFLETKPSSINKNEHGLTFLGFRIFPDRVLLSQRSKNRFAAKLINKIEEVESGKIDQHSFSQSVMALYGFVGHADSRGFCMKTISKVRTSATGSNRMIRGGSWNNNANNCRSANRGGLPSFRSFNVGFRLVCPRVISKAGQVR